MKVTMLIATLLAGSLETDAAQIQQAWVTTYKNGVTNGNHQALFMKLDPAGNLIVAGRSQNPNGAMDYVTLKYAPNGELLWSARHGSGTSDTPRDLAVDTNGNIHVTGTYDTVKYDGNGNLLWTAPYAGRALALGSAPSTPVRDGLKLRGSTACGRRRWMGTRES